MNADMVICGAGISGISAAYSLAVHHRIRQVLLVDERDPLSLTSDKSTECYRNWWPDEAMVALMNRSIDKMEELALANGNSFHLNRRGYLYITCDPNRPASLLNEARRISQAGGGPLRLHNDQAPMDPYIPGDAEQFQGQPTGADLITNPKVLQDQFPYLTKQATAALHVRRAGWFSAHQLGMELLNTARQNGATFLRSRIEAVEKKSGRISCVKLSDGSRINTDCFINAAGPYLSKVGKFMDTDIPVFNELHQIAALRDPYVVLPRQAPLIINLDPQFLDWPKEERLILEEDESTRRLTGELPGGAHTRPEGNLESQMILLLWDYHNQVVEPVFPPALNEFYAELALRGMVKVLPGLERYIGRSSRPIVDGGYYTRTIENRPLIGPLPVDGAYVCGAFAGYGLMAACAAGELLAAHVTRSKLPTYAPAFLPNRYDDPAYQKKISNWGDTGQL